MKKQTTKKQIRVRAQIRAGFPSPSKGPFKLPFP